MHTCAIIVCGGSGKRFSGNCKKQYALLSNKPVLAHTIYPFQKSDSIDEIVLVVPKDDIETVKSSIVEKFEFTKVTNVVAGGEQRQDSVYNGLRSIKKIPDKVFIHDGVRPFIRIKEIEAAAKASQESNALIFAIKPRNTVKEIDESGDIVKTHKRENLFEALTPQIFSYDIIMTAHELAKEKNYYSTDDSALVERIGEKVKVFEGSSENIKLTFESDMLIAKKIMENWSY